MISEKVKNINILEPLPFAEPEETVTSEMEVVDEENLSETTENSVAPADEVETPSKPEKKQKPSDDSLDLDDEDLDDEGQITLF